MTSLAELAGTSWKGRGELWLDPLGNEAIFCDCSLQLSKEIVRYQWSHEEQPQHGELRVASELVQFTDTFHASQPMQFTRVADAWGLLSLFGTYTAGDGPAWGWKIFLSLRHSNELVLQMTNIAPWGEEVRAVRMIFQPVL